MAKAFQESSRVEQQQMPPERTGGIVWWLLVLAAITALVIVRLSRQSPEEPRAERHPAVGTPLSKFSLLPLTGEGKEVTPATLDGKVTLVNFWGPWCPACAAEFPHLVELEQHFRGQEGFQFFSVSSNYNPFDETGLAQSTADFLRRYKAEFPTYRDPKAETVQAIQQAVQVEGFGYPVTLVIGPERKILALWVGYGEGDEKEMRRAIEAALAGENKVGPGDGQS